MRYRALGFSVALIVALVAAALPVGAQVGTRPPPPPGRSMLWDGSFERPVNTGVTSQGFRAGRHIRSWRVTAGKVWLPRPVAFVVEPPDGVQMLQLRDLMEPTDGEVCQTVANLVPGSSYRVRFLVVSIVARSTVDVSFGGAPVLHLDLDRAAIPAVFDSRAATVTATTTSADLCFHGHAVDLPAFPLIDAVRFKPVEG